MLDEGIFLTELIARFVCRWVEREEGIQGWSIPQRLFFRLICLGRSRSEARIQMLEGRSFPKAFKYIFVAKLRVPKTFVEDGRGAWVEYDEAELAQEEYEDKDDGPLF